MTESKGRVFGTGASFELPDGSTVTLKALTLNDHEEFEVFCQEILQRHAINAGASEKRIDRMAVVKLGESLADEYLNTIQGARFAVWLSIRGVEQSQTVNGKMMIMRPFSDIENLAKRIPNGTVIREMLVQVLNLTRPPKGDEPGKQVTPQEPGKA